MNDPWFTEAHSPKEGIRRFKLKCSSRAGSYDYNLWYHTPGVASPRDSTACWTASVFEHGRLRPSGERETGPCTYTGMCASPEEALKQLMKLVASATRSLHEEARLLEAQACALGDSLQHVGGVMRRGLDAAELLKETEDT